MLKESPLTALTSKFIIPEFTLCLRKSDFIKAEKKKKEKGKMVQTFAVTCTSREMFAWCKHTEAAFSTFSKYPYSLCAI